mmetsp:Transcript_47284/g.62579  ORF Transcript_47284/g.62579 Transcript_47284/m.62579 type:complete len:93 (+) Transcript_47284:2566-2844(+)
MVIVMRLIEAATGGAPTIRIIHHGASSALAAVVLIALTVVIIVLLGVLLGLLLLLAHSLLPLVVQHVQLRLAKLKTSAEPILLLFDLLGLLL